MAGIGHLTVLQGHGEFSVGLRTNAANQVVHGGYAVRAEESAMGRGLAEGHRLRGMKEIAGIAKIG